jgi:hypothetical protein
MDWTRSPWDVPMPTHNEASPRLLVGTLGRTRVEVASRIQELEPTGPVEKAGPKAAEAWVARRVRAIAVGIWWDERMVKVLEGWTGSE